MKKTLLLLAFLYGSIQMLYSQNQEDGVVSFKLPVRNSLKYNRFLINPTFSFVREQGSTLSFYNKRQWVQFDDAPQTYLVSYSGRYRDNEGVSVGLFQQNYGVLTTFGGVANFAYNVVLQEDSNLTFGLNVGFYKSGLNRGAVISNYVDPSLEAVPSNSLLTVNPGINYGIGSLDFGVSMNNLVLYNFNTSKMVADDPEKSVQAHVMHTGYIDSYGFFDRSKFSAIISSEFKKDKTVISGLMLFSVPKGIWMQGGYNTVYGISGGLGLNLTPKISVEYNFEKGIGNLSNFGSSHEVVFAYRFSSKNYDNSGDEEEGALITPSEKKKYAYVKPKEKESTILSPIDANKLKEQQDALAKAKAEEKEKQLAAAKAKTEVIVEAPKEKEVAKTVDIVKPKETVVAQAPKAKEAPKAVEIAKPKADNAAEAQRIADAKAKADATAEAQRIADAKAKADATAEAQRIADAKAKANATAEAQRIADAKAKADATAEAQRIADAKAKADATAEAQRIADAKAKANATAEAQRIADAKAKANATAEAQGIADAKAKADATAEAQRIADAKAKADATAEAQRIADAKAKADATAEAQRIADAKAKADATAEAQRIADAKAKADATAEAQRIADAKAKADATAEAQRIADAKAKADATAEAQRIADAKAKADADAAAKLAATTKKDDNAKAMDELARVLEQSKNRQKQLLGQLESTVNSKEKELKELKEENDLSDKGIYKDPKPFKSTADENNAIESLKQQIAEENKKQSDKIKDLDNLYKERLAKVPNSNDATNQNYKNTIDQLKTEQLKVVNSNKELITSLEKIKVDTEIEKKRRIKRRALKNYAYFD